MPEVLHYRGYRIPFYGDHMLGPDMDRRYLAPKRADYDPATDVTTLTLRPIMPAEFRERVTALAEKERDRERIRALFNA